MKISYTCRRFFRFLSNVIYLECLQPILNQHIKFTEHLLYWKIMLNWKQISIFILIIFQVLICSYTLLLFNLKPFTYFFFTASEITIAEFYNWSLFIYWQVGIVLQVLFLKAYEIIPDKKNVSKRPYWSIIGDKSKFQCNVSLILSRF